MAGMRAMGWLVLVAACGAGDEADPVGTADADTDADADADADADSDTDTDTDTDTGATGDTGIAVPLDGFGDLSSIVYEAANVPFYAVSYTRDEFGRVATKTEARPTGAMLRCYEYDASDRLAAVYDGGDSNGCVGTQLEAYTYDLNGNRTSKTDKTTLQATTYTYDVENQLIGVTIKRLIWRILSSGLHLLKDNKLTGTAKEQRIRDRFLA